MRCPESANIHHPVGRKGRISMLTELLESEIGSIKPTQSCRISEFEDFAGDMHIAACMKLPTPPIHFPLQSISKSLWDIETTIHRIQWQKELCLDEKIDFGQWYLYAQADIRLFHVEARSLLDHLGLCIKHICNGQKPKDSFNALRENHERYYKNGIIPQDIYEIIRDCRWFEPLRDIRDQIVHFGAEVIVFGVNIGEPVLFSVSKNNKSMIKDIRFKHNENDVYNFENYAAYHLANIYHTLDLFGKAAYSLSKIKRTSVNGASRSHGGLAVIRSWMQALLQQIKSNVASQTNSPITA